MRWESADSSAEVWLLAAMRSSWGVMEKFVPKTGLCCNWQRPAAHSMWSGSKQHTIASVP